MACVDSDEISHAVELVLHDVWKVVGALKAPQQSSSWLSEFQWKQFRQCCVRIMERTRRERLSIGLVAPMRSGKSTMLNALLGIALLPTDPRLSAKRPITVHYTPRRKGSKLKLVEHNGKISTGLEGVRQRLHELLESPSNDDWHMEPSLELNAALCKTLGSEADSTVVKLDLTEILSLSSVSPYGLCRDKIKTSLEDLDGAFFLIDATKLQTEGEAEMIKELKESFPTYMPQFGHRLYFCVTKADIPIDAEEADHTELQNYVTTLLQDAGFQTQPSQVFVMSPLTALVSRLVIADKNDADVHMQFCQLAWGKLAESNADKALWKAKAVKLLELSGILKFEDQVLGFLHRNCEALKLISLLDEANRTLQHILDAAHSFKTTLSRTLNDSRHSMDRLKSQLDNGLLQLEATKTELLQIEKDAPIKVQEILIKLKNVLLQRIGSALACEFREERVNAGELPCGWLSIRQDFLALINHIEPDQKHAEELVKELHEEVTGQIRSEMEIAWMVVEELIRDRHFELVLRTNQDLDYLSKVLEPIVIKDLNIQIEPAAIKLKQINNLSFQKDVGELLGAAIKQQTLERTFLSRYIWGAQYSAFFFDGAAIREFFENIVREITDDAIHQLQSSVRRHVSGQIASSEEKIRSFGETFTQGIQAAIESRVVTLDSNAISMQRVIEDIDTVKKLKNVITSLRRRIETGLSTGQPSESQQTTTAAPQQPELHIQCQKKEETEAKEADPGRYIPPRSRPPAQEAITPKLTPHDRADSFAFSDLSESLLESPHSATFSRSNGGSADNWRLGRSASAGWSSWNAPNTVANTAAAQRSAWSAVNQPTQTPPRETPTSAHAPAGDNFSPRSNFFRSFQQTSRAGRGRGHEIPPPKSPHWSG